MPPWVSSIPLITTCIFCSAEFNALDPQGRKPSNLVVQVNNREAEPAFGISPNDLRTDLEELFPEEFHRQGQGKPGRKYSIHLTARTRYKQAPESIQWSLLVSATDPSGPEKMIRCEGVTNGNDTFPFAVRQRAIKAFGTLVGMPMVAIPARINQLPHPSQLKLISSPNPFTLTKVSHDHRIIGLVTAEVLFDEAGAVADVPYMEGPDLFRPLVREFLLASKFDPIGKGQHIAVVRFQINPLGGGALSCFDGSIDLHLSHPIE